MKFKIVLILTAARHVTAANSPAPCFGRTPMVRHRKVLPNGAPSVGARRPCRSVPVSECWIYLYLTTQGNSDEGYSENQGAYLGINSKNMVSCTDETNEREQGGRKEGRVELVKEQGNYDSTTQGRVAHEAALLIWR